MKHPQYLLLGNDGQHLLPKSHLLTSDNSSSSCDSRLAHMVWEAQLLAHSERFSQDTLIQLLTRKESLMMQEDISCVRHLNG